MKVNLLSEHVRRNMVGSAAGKRRRRRRINGWGLYGPRLSKFQVDPGCRASSARPTILAAAWYITSNRARSRQSPEKRERTRKEKKKSPKCHSNSFCFAAAAGAMTLHSRPAISPMRAEREKREEKHASPSFFNRERSYFIYMRLEHFVFSGAKHHSAAQCAALVARPLPPPPLHRQ